MCFITKFCVCEDIHFLLFCFNAWNEWKISRTLYICNTSDLLYRINHWSMPYATLYILWGGRLLTPSQHLLDKGLWLKHCCTINHWCCRYTECGCKFEQFYFTRQLLCTGFLRRCARYFLPKHFDVVSMPKIWIQDDLATAKKKQ